MNSLSIHQIEYLTGYSIRFLRLKFILVTKGTVINCDNPDGFRGDGKNSFKNAFSWKSTEEARGFELQGRCFIFINCNLNAKPPCPGEMTHVALFSFL